MKCPECGQWNRASMPHCVMCGAPLNIDEASRIAWKETLKDGGQSTAWLRADEYGQITATTEPRDALASEMQKLKERKREGEKLQERLRAEASGKPSSLIAEEIAPPSDPNRKGPTAQTSTFHLRRTSAESIQADEEAEIRHKVRFMNDSGIYVEARTYDDPFPAGGSRGAAYRLSPALGGPPEEKPRRHRGLKLLLLLVIIAGLAVGGVYGYHYFFPSAEDEAVSDAIITASMLNDSAAHTILIPGDDSTTIYVRELHASYPVVDGFCTLEIPDHFWYDNIEGSLGETMEVTLTPFVKYKGSGKQEPLVPIKYDITIPLSRITLEQPDSMRTTVSTTMSTIKINVVPGSKVTVNGVDCSDTVASDTGDMSYNATVQPIGDNVFNFVVRSQYCRDNTLTVVLYRAPQEIPLDLAVGTYGTTDRQTMKVTATTLPGAYVEVTTPHSDLDITELDSTGKFSFYAVFDKIGDNIITIKASYPGKKTSVVDHKVYYLPPPDEYTVKAWPLTPEGYSELLSNMPVRAANNQVYVVKGIVQYEVSEKPQKVVINTSEDGKSQPVLLQNYSNKKWVVGTYYRIYADAYSTYNGMPYLNARYTYYK